MRRIIAISFLLWSGMASAQWYAGGTAGQGSVSITDNTLPITGAPATSLSKSETSGVFKGLAGYRVNRNFAVEGGYADLGSYSATRTVLAIPAGSLSGDIKASGFFVDALGIVPSGPTDFFGKIGYMRTTTKASVSASGAVILLSSPNAEATGWSPRWGFGVQYHVQDNLNLRVEFERTLSVGDKSKTGESDVDVFGLGATFSF